MARTLCKTMSLGVARENSISQDQYHVGKTWGIRNVTILAKVHVSDKMHEICKTKEMITQANSLAIVLEKKVAEARVVGHYMRV